MATETITASEQISNPHQPPLSLAQLIERHRMAKAAWEAQPEDQREQDDDPLFDALGEAHAAVAYAPAANDAEFIEKLRFLFIEEQDWGDWIDTSVGSPGGSIFAALEIQFEA